MDGLFPRLAPRNAAQARNFGPARRRREADGDLAGTGRVSVTAFLRCVVLAAAWAAAGCGAGDPHAPLPPLHHTFPSPEALSEAVLAALADRDADTLAGLALSELEFRTAVWPDLPASRPERGVPFEYAWGDLRQKSGNALRRLLARHGGRRYELVRVSFEGETTPYRTYRVHRETLLDVRDEESEALTLALFGSILEREGEFKLFSYVVD